MKQKRDRYEMHKYWGKKPSNNLRALIEKYSDEGDTILDPFSGYGVFCCEAYLLNRNVISNDLNPIANFLNSQLLESEIDLNLLVQQWNTIKAEFEPFNQKWFSWNLNGSKIQLISILRNKSNVPLKGKYRVDGSRKATEFDMDEQGVQSFLEFENSQVINDWFPSIKLIQNSRISAKKGMSVSDLFTKRTLACHARLLALIETHSSGKELDLFKVAFTANLANCSRLVPPIKSRGEMAPGAWMTGFYIGETYLENNVLYYFENRLSKVIKGKRDFLNNLQRPGELNLYQPVSNHFYEVQNSDAKRLPLASNSIDFIFTDPPYGDAVPYFEQSIIWNSWLKYSPDYPNEIVISDSKERKKSTDNFENEIQDAFSEIRRVLKDEKFFSLTYHSLSGKEWKAITNACILNGFELVDFQWMVQKSFTPRQINRLKSIKGDVLVTFQKMDLPTGISHKPDLMVAEIFRNYIETWLRHESLDTNEIFLRIMKIVFAEKILIGEVDLLNILTENFQFSDDQKWIIHDELRVS